ncbi:hypothetical protein [Streptomyces sp. NPDC001076]
MATGQAPADDRKFGLGPAHCEINTYGIGQLLPLILFLDHGGEYEARRSRIKVVTGESPKVPQQHAEVEPVSPGGAGHELLSQSRSSTT